MAIHRDHNREPMLCAPCHLQGCRPRSKPLVVAFIATVVIFIFLYAWHWQIQRPQVDRSFLSSKEENNFAQNSPPQAQILRARAQNAQNVAARESLNLPGHNLQAQNLPPQNVLNLPPQSFQNLPSQNNQNLPSLNFQKLPSQSFQNQPAQNLPSQNVQKLPSQKFQNQPAQNLPSPAQMFQGHNFLVQNLLTQNLSLQNLSSQAVQAQNVMSPQHLTSPNLPVENFKSQNLSPQHLPSQNVQTKPAKNYSSRKCDILTSMVQGRWEPHNYTQEEMANLTFFIKTTRAQHGLPATLQRADGRCGDVTFSELVGVMDRLLWFRALCNPDGPTPCCFHNACTAGISAQQCQCPDCYDLRRPIHAEFASWVPFDPACQQVPYFHDKTDICPVLKNTTLLMVGDSFVRHVHIAVLSMLRTDKSYGPRRWNTSQALLNKCRDDFIYQHNCAIALDTNAEECNSTLKMRFLEYIAVHSAKKILTSIRELRGVPNSYVLLGVGLHDDFNFESIARTILEPLLEFIKSTRWPEVIWLSIHSPGLLKTPKVPSQSAESILLYNQKVKALLQTERTYVPILDFYDLTKATMSFDGAHYGRGVNKVKAQVFLNYLLERRKVASLP